MAGTNLSYLVPTPGDPDGTWAGKLKAALDLIELAHGGVSMRAKGATFDGVTDDTTAVLAAIAACPVNGVVVMEGPGTCRCSPAAFNTNKGIRFVNPGPPGGEFSMRIKPTADVANTGDGIVWFTGTNYGAGLFNIGVDMTGLVKAVGVKFGPNEAHYKLRSYWSEGGYRGFELRGPHPDVDGFYVSDPLDCGFFIDEGGLEGPGVRNGTVARNLAGTTDAYWKCQISGSAPAQLGALRLHGVIGNSSAGSAIVNRPFEVESVNPVEMTCFITKCEADNCHGPALVSRVQGLGFDQGWLNCAAGSRGVFLFNAAHNVRVTNNRYRGGTGGSKCTYEWTGATSIGFISKDNECPTGPLYKNPSLISAGTGLFDDQANGATGIAQITDDETAFNAAGGLLWGPRRFQGKVSLMQPLQVAFPAVWTGAMVGGSVTLDAPGAGSAYSWFIPFVITPGGTTGSLKHSSTNPTGGTGGLGSVTFVSTSGSETSTIGYLRLDIPH